MPGQSSPCSPRCEHCKVEANAFIFLLSTDALLAALHFLLLKQHVRFHWVTMVTLRSWKASDVFFFFFTLS